MLSSLLIPLPVLAAQWTLSITSEVIVHERGRVLAPRSLRGMPAERAAQLLPGSTVVPRRPDWEHAAWDRIVEEVWKITPYLTTVQPGRLVCTPDDLPRLQRVITHTRAQAGCGPTQMMSTLAALSAHPGTMQTVETETSAQFLETLPVASLMDLDELQLTDEIVERLQLFGLQTVGRLRLLTRHHLTVQFGDVGARLHAMLSSIGDARPLPLYQPPPSICEQERFDDAVREPSVVQQAVERCVDRAVERLDGRLAQRLDVALLNNADGIMRTRTRILRQPLGLARPFYAQSTAMLASILGPKVWSWGVWVRLAALRTPRTEQLPLFRPRPTLDEINTPLSQRFPNAIKRISVVDPFAYLPERFASVEPWKPCA